MTDKDHLQEDYESSYVPSYLVGCVDIIGFFIYLNKKRKQKKLENSELKKHIEKDSTSAYCLTHELGDSLE